MRWHEVGNLVEPPHCQLVENLSSIRHGTEDMIEGRQPVGRNQSDRVTKIDDVSHLPGRERAERRNSRGIDPGERVSQSRTQIETHRAPATKASNRGSPNPPSGPEGRCQSRTWSSGWGINPTIVPPSSQIPAMSLTEPFGLAG